MLQNAHMHKNVDYLNLAYTTIIEYTDDAEQKARLFDEWDRARADFADDK